MAETSDIEWTDATWNPITGCSVVSPGCTNCYAMKLAGTRMKRHPSRSGLTRSTKAGPVWTGEVRFNEQWLTQPLEWKRPKRVFVCAHGDLFAEGVPDEWVDRIFAVMALAPQHTFQVLTKRPERMRDYLLSIARKDYHLLAVGIAGAAGEIAYQAFNGKRDRDEVCEQLAHAINPDEGNWPLRNVWLGVSVEDQARANERIPFLLTTPAAVRFISAEPLLGPIDLSDVFPDATGSLNALTGEASHRLGFREQAGKLDWVIVGGESQAGARPMHPGWATDLRDQCRSAGVPFFFKQWGEWRPGVDGERLTNTVINDPRSGPVLMVQAGKANTGRLLFGREWSEMPRQSPSTLPPAPEAVDPDLARWADDGGPVVGEYAS